MAEDKVKQESYYYRLLKKEWSYITGGVLLGLVATALVIVTNRPWGVTGAFGPWGGKVLEAIGIRADSWPIFNGSLARYNFWTQQPSMTNPAIVLGALLSVLLASSFKIKKIRTRRQVFAAILGGLLMGIGDRFALGCNIGNFFSAIPAFSLHGWVFGFFSFLGGMVGSRLLKRYFMGTSVCIESSREDWRERRKRQTPQQRRRKQLLQISAGVILLVLVCLFAMAAQQRNPNGGFIILAGVALGYILQRSRFCFTASLRDPFLTGGTNLTKAVIIGIAASSVIFMALNMQKLGFGLEHLDPSGFNGVGLIKEVGIPSAIGAFIFGIGMVIAGGCASGMLMRMGEGFLQQWMVFFFFVTGWITGRAIDSVVFASSSTPVFLRRAPGIFLPEALGGWIPAVIIHFGLLLAAYIAVDMWGRRKARLSQ